MRGGESDAAVFAPIAERIRILADMWPSLEPPPEVDSQAARLYGTAAEVEIHALVLP